MVKRAISKDKYWVASVITLLVFVLGITLGIVLDNARLQWIEEDQERQEAEQRSIQFVYAYLSSLEAEETNCHVMQIALEAAVKDLGKSLEVFASFKEQTKLNSAQYEIAGRRYIIDNLRYWYFARTNKERCSSELVPALYFYSDEDCVNCPDQGKILTYFKKLLGERVLIFPINVDLDDEEVAITIVKGKYNISTVPSVVINEKAYTGLLERQELGELICSSFEHEQEECEPYISS
ncbi:MAG: hypothetical protein ACE5FT_00115 [Candidatus Nanoarchaeia archaeon]